MSETDHSAETTGSTIRDFFELLKPKIMSLVVFTGFAGYWIAPGRETLHPLLAFAGLAALALGAGAAGAFNMWYDRDIDASMNRTKNRPLPRGKIMADDALGFAIFASVFSIMLMGLATNWTAAFLLAAGNGFYVLVYTMWLKRRTPQNIVIGGAAGAFPPVIGWAMVTGSLTLEPWLLFALIFFWTPPHFWALALFANDDYRRANVPMLPVIVGEHKTKVQMLAYSVLLLPLSVAPYFLGYTTIIYGIFSTLLSGVFLLAAWQVYQEKEGYKAARRMFGYSVFYLFAIFLAYMLTQI